jgi:hypothetical protein
MGGMMMLVRVLPPDKHEEIMTLVKETGGALPPVTPGAQPGSGSTGGGTITGWRASPLRPRTSSGAVAQAPQGRGAAAPGRPAPIGAGAK